MFWRFEQLQTNAVNIHHGKTEKKNTKLQTKSKTFRKNTENLFVVMLSVAVKEIIHTVLLPGLV